MLAAALALLLTAGAARAVDLEEESVIFYFYTSLDATDPARESHRIEIGDFDGDGNGDLVVAFRSSDEIGLLLGDGSGTFAIDLDELHAAGSDWPNALAVADFDGDENLDVALGTFLGSRVRLFMGDGEGDLTAKDPIVTSQVDELAAGDLDGDEDLDLVVTHRFTDQMAVLLNDGDGNFAAPGDGDDFENSPYTVGDFPAGVALGDHDDDGDLDAVVANSGDGDDTITILTNTGSDFTTESMAVGDEPVVVEAGQFDGQNGEDFAVGHRTDSDVRIFLSDGEGGLVQSGEPYEFFLQVSKLAGGDLNGDGEADIVVTHSNQASTRVMLGNGGGSFTPETHLFQQAEPSDAAVGDLDADGKPDLATAAFKFQGLNTENRIGAILNLSLPALEVPAELDFGSLQLGQQATDTVTLTSDGSYAPVEIQDVALAPGAFAIAPLGDACSGETLIAGAPAASCEVEVSFDPAAEIDYAGSLEIETDIGEFQVPLAGKGVAIPVPPETAIVRRPAKRLRLRRGARRTKASFRFTSPTVGATFQCRLAPGKRPVGPWRACRSPRTYKGLRPGSYVFQARAISGGKVDLTPATHRFRVIKLKRKRR